MKMIKDLLKRNMTLILASAAAFALGIPAGALTYPLVADKMPSLLQQAFGGILTGTTTEIIMKVFARNAQATTIMLILGMTVILAILSLFINGFVVGLVFRFAQEKGLSITQLLLGIIPHGIFELPAVFISAAMGIRIGIAAATSKGARVKATAQAIREAAAVYLSIVVPLLVAAAFMEILVSKNLIK